VLFTDREAGDPPCRVVVVKDALERSVATDPSQGATRYDSGPPGRLIVDVGQESDRNFGIVELAPQRSPVARLIVFTENVGTSESPGSNHADQTLPPRPAIAVRLLIRH